MSKSTISRLNHLTEGLEQKTNKVRSSPTGGIGFLGLLALIFITLKLCSVINWSWWLVLLPLYGPLTVILAIVLVIVLIYGIACAFDKD